MRLLSRRKSPGIPHSFLININRRRKGLANRLMSTLLGDNVSIQPFEH